MEPSKNTIHILITRFLWFNYNSYFCYLAATKQKEPDKTMKKQILTFLCLLIFTGLNAQSDNEIAGVYIKRSQESLNNLEILCYPI